ncbi:hypothetical protein COO60DRAFT_1701147 [Scenedesmus sp. NREL 46B-D3]|nr:hypothetical protein COO60DRAFT_1701147 [Scenedesmus sp. NREL 46B-D3]
MQATQGADSSDVAAPSIEDVFSLRRPKDLRAGLSSGLKSAGKGILGGAVGLLAAPVVGATTDGLPGFAKGVAAGVAGAVLLPVTGVTVGVVQVARGVANQPTALLESLRGKVWDQERRTWVEQPQCAVTTYSAAAAAAATAHWQRPGLPLLQANAQLDYYALLEVQRDASPEQIKRQYYKLARRHHPDKNAGDLDAHERFQQLGHAYQVLSAPALRRRYDAAGASAVAGVDWLEPGAFFAALFGSELFEHLVGELAIATMAQAAEDGGDGPSAAELRALQTARIQRLAVLLAALLRRFVEGDAEGFMLAMRLEAERLAAASFGLTLLHCIGHVYSRQADIYLGGVVGGTLARVKLGRDSVRSHMNIANAALRVISHQEKVVAFDRQRELRRQQQQQQQQQQHVIGEPNMTAEELQAAASNLHAEHAAGAAGTAAESGSDSGASLPEALDAWNAVWFGNSSSTAAAAAGTGTAAPAAAGTPTAAGVEQQHKQQQWPSSAAAAAENIAASNGSIGAGGDRDTASLAGGCADAGSPAGAAAADAAAAGATAAADGAQASADELLQRAQLEDAGLDLMLQAMWAANVVDIQGTLGSVCRAVLHDGRVSRAGRRLRAAALRELGAVFCAAQGPGGSSSSSSAQGAKQQMQAAYEAVMSRQMAQQDAADLQ